MAHNKVFPEGLYVHKPHARAPHFVKASIAIFPEKLIRFLKANPHLMRGDKMYLSVLESKNGQYYPVVDTYQTQKDDQEPQPEPVDDDIPF